MSENNWSVFYVRTIINHETFLKINGETFCAECIHPKRGKIAKDFLWNDAKIERVTGDTAQCSTCAAHRRPIRPTDPWHHPRIDAVDVVKQKDGTFVRRAHWIEE